MRLLAILSSTITAPASQAKWQAIDTIEFPGGTGLAGELEQGKGMAPGIGWQAATFCPLALEAG